MIAIVANGGIIKGITQRKKVQCWFEKQKKQKITKEEEKFWLC